MFSPLLAQADGGMDVLKYIIAAVVGGGFLKLVEFVRKGRIEDEDRRRKRDDEYLKRLESELERCKEDIRRNVKREQKMIAWINRIQGQLIQFNSTRQEKFAYDPFDENGEDESGDWGAVTMHGPEPHE